MASCLRASGNQVKPQEIMDDMRGSETTP